MKVLTGKNRRKKQDKLNVRGKYLQKKYGITVSDYTKILHSQRGVCFFCSATQRLCVDHRHTKNYNKLSSPEKQKEVRGLLCFRHNKFTVGGVEIDKNARQTLKKLNEYFSIYKIKGD